MYNLHVWSLQGHSFHNLVPGLPDCFTYMHENSGEPENIGKHLTMTSRVCKISWKTYLTEWFTVKRHFHVCDKFMPIRQNGPLDLFNKILKLKAPLLIIIIISLYTSSPASEEEGAGGGWSADPNRALVRAASAEMSVGDDEVSATLERPQPNECWNRQFLLLLLQLLWWAIKVWITFFRCH